MKRFIAIIIFITITALSGFAIAGDSAPKSSDYMPSLITATPLEGRMLAITIVRKTIGTIQRDSEAKHRIRKIYAEDPMMLMRAVELVSMEFKIIAEANNYWRK
ncbi:hexameric tyrosine-coordinated heme protein [bacterium]|nr:hexameric tyrosine-coordinated heme protein [bacterium]